MALELAWVLHAFGSAGGAVSMTAYVCERRLVSRAASQELWLTAIGFWVFHVFRSLDCAVLMVASVCDRHLVLHAASREVWVTAIRF